MMIFSKKLKELSDKEYKKIEKTLVEMNTLLHTVNINEIDYKTVLDNDDINHAAVFAYIDLQTNNQDDLLLEKRKRDFKGKSCD